METNSFSENEASSDGGAVYASDVSGVNLSGNSMDSNRAISAGGGITILASENVTVNSNNFFSNTASDGNTVNFVDVNICSADVH